MVLVSDSLLVKLALFFKNAFSILPWNFVKSKALLIEQERHDWQDELPSPSKTTLNKQTPL